MSSLEIVRIGDGIWRDREGTRYLTDSAVERRTRLPRRTLRSHSGTDDGVLRSIDRGAGARPRWLTLQAEVDRYLRTAGTAETDSKPDLPVEALARELLTENETLRQQLVADDEDISALERANTHLRASVRDLQAALDEATDLANRRRDRQRRTQ